MLTEDSSYETLAHELGPNWRMGLLAHVLPAVSLEATIRNAHETG